MSVFGQVLESTVEGNAGTGVAAYEGSVESCRVVENDGRGVYGNHTLITDNVILWNGDFAITGENNGYGRNVLLTEVGHLGSGNHVEIAPNLCLNSSGGTIDCTVCPNGACELPESNSSCPADCPPVCGDGFCYAASETCTCPSDCGSPCGDGLCNCGETVGTCSIDCR